MVFLYLIKTFVKRVYIFLKHWYINGVKKIFYLFIEVLRGLDRSFALKITLKNIFTPLYKDYSFLGYIMGFFLRLARIAFASCVYLFLLFVFLWIGIFWCLIPAYLLFYSLGIIYV